MTRKEKLNAKNQKINMAYLLILGAALIISMFISFAQVETEEISHTFSMHELIDYGEETVPKDDLGMLSGLTAVDEDAEEVMYEGDEINILSKLNMLWGVYALAVLVIAFAFLKDSYLKAAIYTLGSFVLAGLPIYALTALTGAEDTIVGLVDVKTTFAGFAFPFVTGLLLLVLSIGFINRTSKTFAKTNTKEQTKTTVFTVATLVTFAAYFMPLFEIDMKVGLANVRTYWLSASSFFGVIDNVLVNAVYTSFGQDLSISFLKLFMIIPILCILSLALLQLKDKKFSRIALGVQAVVSASFPIMTVTILKTNVELFTKANRIVAGTGSIIMVVMSIVIGVYLFVTSSAGQISDRIEHSRKRHNQIYAILISITAAVLLSPQYGVLVKTAKAIGILDGTFNQKIRVPLTMFDVSAITGNVFTMVIYLMVIALIMLIVTLIAKRYASARVSAVSMGILSMLSYVSTYTALKNFVGDEGIVQLRVSAMLLIALSIGYLFAGYTDRDEKLALTKVNNRASNIFKYTALGGFTIMQLYPVIWMFLSSFMTNTEIFSGRVFALPEKWQFRNYSRAIVSTRYEETLHDAVARVFGEVSDANIFKYVVGATPTGNIIRYFANSLLVTVITVAAIVLFSAMAAYALRRIKWKLSGVMYVVFILGMMIPVHVAITPLYVFFANIGWINEYVSLIIPYVGFGFSIPIIIFYGFMGGIPYEIEEAASIDGAGRIRAFFQLILPMSASAIATVTIFSFLGSWNELMFASLFINEGAKKTITVGVYHMATSQYSTDYGLLFAGLFIASIPTIAFYLLASDQVQKSLTTGSVKG